MAENIFNDKLKHCRKKKERYYLQDILKTKTTICNIIYNYIVQENLSKNVYQKVKMPGSILKELTKTFATPEFVRQVDMYKSNEVLGL